MNKMAFIQNFILSYVRKDVAVNFYSFFPLKIAIDTLFLKIFVVVFRGVFVLFIAIALEILSLPIECGGRGKSAILANLN